jgi:hypothetical protein
MKIVHFDIDPMDLQRIEKMIRNSDTITTIRPVDIFDRYFLGDYVKETEVEKNKFFALLDRNIYTDIVAVAKSSDTKQHSPQQKVACALLAFMQLADVTIEPNIAINEYIDSDPEHHEEAVAELRLFRAVDNLKPRILMELALGRRNKIPASMLNWQEDESVEPKRGEDHLMWKIHYGFALKMAIIDLQGKSTVAKLKSYLDWVYKEYVFINTAIIFGLVLFSKNRFKGMLKKIGSGDKDKVLRGVRNAAWDMTVAYYWSEKAMREKENGIFWLLCTADKALRAVATSLVVTGDELEQKKKAIFIKYLGKEKGKQIYEMFIEMQNTRSDDSSRRQYKLGHVSNLYPVVDELEKELLSKMTKHKCKREN